MEIKFKYIIIAVASILLMIGGFICYLSYLNDQIEAKELAIKMQRQNEQALKDFISMQADSIQDYAIFVEDLQTDNSKLEKKYNLLKTKYYILIDSIAVLNGEADVDTTGNTIKISFDSTYKKIDFEGYTLYYKNTGKGTYSLKIVVAPSVVESEVYLDEESKLIRNKIYVDGALIDSARTTIDSTLYKLIQTNKLDCPDELGFFDRLRLLIDVNQTVKREGVIYTPDKFSTGIGMEYQFPNVRIQGQYDIINSEIKAGIQYHPSLKDIWNAIF